MTNEQQIEVLNRMRCNVKEDSVEDQALYMAISALDDKDINVPSNDTISRQDTITEIKNYERDSTAPIDYVKIVEQMPPAQPDARYINANELIKRLQQVGLDDAVSIAVKMAGYERLKHVPSAQSEPKKGEWIVNGTLINCSVCKHCAWSRHAFEDIVRGFNFCPNCGKPMKRGEQDE